MPLDRLDPAILATTPQEDALQPRAVEHDDFIADGELSDFRVCQSLRRSNFEVSVLG